MKRYLLPVIPITLSTLICLVISEFILHHFLPIKPKVYQADDYFLYKLIPNSKKTFTHLPENGGEKIHIKINSLGFRGNEFRNEPNCKRIVVYGDSFVEGEFSRLEDTFVKQLERELAPKCQFPIEIINAGVIGYGPDQIERRIEREVDFLRPHLIIVVFFADNDFGDLLRNKMYRLDANGRIHENPYFFSKQVKDRLKNQDKLVLIYRMKKLYWRLLSIYRKFSQKKYKKNGAGRGQPLSMIQIWLEECREEYRNYILKKDNEIKQIRRDHYDADISLTPKSDSAKYKIRLMEQVLKKVHDNLASRGVPFVLLIVPSPIDVCENYDFSVDTSQYPKYDPKTLTNIVVKCAENVGIPFLNLFQPFREKSPNLLYFHHGDDHWNSKGQKLAAKLMRDFILINKIIDCR